MLRSRFVIVFVASLLPVVASAQVTIDTGVHSSIGQVFQGVINTIFGWSGIIATGIFLVGAMLMIGSGGNDQLLSSGKRLMKAAIIGLAIVLASWMMMSSLVYFLYA